MKPDDSTVTEPAPTLVPAENTPADVIVPTFPCTDHAMGAVGIAFPYASRAVAANVTDEPTATPALGGERARSTVGPGAIDIAASPDSRPDANADRVASPARVSVYSSVTSLAPAGIAIRVTGFPPASENVPAAELVRSVSSIGASRVTGWPVALIALAVTSTAPPALIEVAPVET